MLSRLSARCIRFLKQEDGPTAVEYAVMLALIVVVCIGAITTLAPMPTQPSLPWVRQSVRDRSF